MSSIDSLPYLGLLVMIVTMPVFALLRRGRAVDADVARRPASILLGPWIRDWAMWMIGPVERAAVRARVSPDLCNFIGAAAGAAAGVSFGGGELPVGAWCLIVSGAADILDGRIARARRVASARGAFLDSTLDRFGETFVWTGVAVYLSDRPVAIAATVLALGGSMLVSYVRARGEALGVAYHGGLMQRAERLVLLTVGALVDPVLTRSAEWPSGVVLAWVVATIALGSLATAAHRTRAIASALREPGPPA